ncbi:MAG: ABC transporter ATP-binding protein, partial [Verrucomicrobiae bacterium]|nr:ABC transporter ATP-binding protein [Verrucomicrobiae bacterium]
VALVLAKIGIDLLQPWPLKLIIDRYLTHGRFDLPAIALLCGSLVGIYLISGGLNLVATYIQVKIGLKALVRVRCDLYGKLQHLSLKYHDQRTSGDSIYRVSYNAGAIQAIFNQGFSTVFTALITLAGILIVMFFKSWQLTLLSLAIGPVLLGAISYFARRIRRQTTELSETESRVLSRTQEGIGALRIVRAFGREGYEMNRFEEEATASMRANLNLNFTQVFSALVISTLMGLGAAAMIFLASRLVLLGNLSVGDLTLFLAYLYMLYRPLETLSYTSWALEGAAAGAQRVFEVLDSPETIRDKPGAPALPAAQGAIEISGVRFSYTPDRPVLQGVDLSVRPGEMVALMGPTGSGKSTLLSLLLRFYDPETGFMKIDGHDLRDVRKDSIRDQIGLVLQDTLLLSCTIGENIAYGKLGATPQEIERAAERAQAMEFIRKLPQGMNTYVGERGAQMSVGQRQRIGLARAFLKNAPILLMDEPTSALDPQTEQQLLECIHELMKGRTTIMVTHRIAAAHRCDRIVVLEDGRIVESGSGAELLAKGGAYAKLHSALTETS